MDKIQSALRLAKMMTFPMWIFVILMNIMTVLANVYEDSEVIRYLQLVSIGLWLGVITCLLIVLVYIKKLEKEY